MAGFSIEKVLMVVGIISVAFGILVGGFSYITIDRETYNDTKEMAETLYDNETAQLEYVSAKALYDAEKDAALTTLFGGILSGLLFVGFATVIESLKSSEQASREMRDALNQIKRNNQASS